MLLYFLVEDKLDNITKRADNKLKIVDHFIESSLTRANQILYGLSLALAKQEINLSNLQIKNIIKSFDPSVNQRNQFIPFIGLKVLDINES